MGAASLRAWPTPHRRHTDATQTPHWAQPARRHIRKGRPPLVKICCIASDPGAISDAVVAQVTTVMREQTVRTVLLTSGTGAESIAAQQQAAGASTLKLADHASPADLRQRQQGCPGVELVRGIHVTGEASVAAALTVAPWVDAVLLDSGNPALAVKELGGTGRAHDWALSRRLREAIHPLPLWLAGGLRLHNVAEAIAAVQPHGVDLCTGVRVRAAVREAGACDLFGGLSQQVRRTVLGGGNHPGARPHQWPDGSRRWSPSFESSGWCCA